MKRMILAITILALIAASLLPVSAAEQNFGRSYTIPKGTPQVDGEVDSVWSNAEWTEVDKAIVGNTGSDSTMKIMLLWDESSLYFLAEVYDSDLNKENDLIEIYYDLLKDGGPFYYDDTQTPFLVADGRVKNYGLAELNPQIDAVCVSVPAGKDTYIMEGAMRWQAGLVPSVGRVIGMEFMYSDATAEKDFIEAYRWNVNTPAGAAPPQTDTTNYGTVILADEVGYYEETSKFDDPYAPMTFPPEVSTAEPQTQPVTTSAPTTALTESTPTTSAPADEKGGCGSVMSLLPVMLIMLGGALLTRTKR